jgi:hypothetical protein
MMAIALNGTTVNGRRGAAIFEVGITKDGRGQKAKLGSLRFAGHLPDGIRRATRDLLEAVTLHYVPGPPAVIETRWPDGSLQARQAFNPEAGPKTVLLTSVDVARLLAAKRGAPERVEAAGDPDDPDRELFATDGLLPGPQAILAGPTFEEWVGSTR